MPFIVPLFSYFVVVVVVVCACVCMYVCECVCVCVWGGGAIFQLLCPSVWVLSRQDCLNCWAVCNQTWYGDAYHEPVLCKRLGLVYTGSRSQGRLKPSKNNCPVSSEPFATNFVMVVHHYEPVWGVNSFKCFLQGQDHRVRCLFLLYFLNHFTMCSQTWCVGVHVYNTGFRPGTGASKDKGAKKHAK